MLTKPKKIIYLTGSRAEWGIVSPLLDKLEKDKFFKLKTYITGMHLMTKHGLSYKLVKKQFPHAKIINNYFKSDSKAQILEFASELLSKLKIVLTKEKPNYILVHGDRIEMLTMAIAASYLQIPLIHTQGGDLSKTIDDKVRHSISQLADIHFPATKDAAQKILGFGKDKQDVHLVGTLALDSIFKEELWSKKRLVKFLGLKNPDYFLVLLHPISEDIKNAAQQMQIVLDAALSFAKNIVLIYPNSDPGSSEMIKVIKKYQKKYSKLIQTYQNLDYQVFLSLEKYAQVWVGNSSAGIVDSPAFKIPVINVGLRQDGRLRSTNIIDTDYNKSQIIKNINYCLTNKKFIKNLAKTKNIWGQGKASEQIIKILKKYEHQKTKS